MARNATARSRKSELRGASSSPSPHSARRLARSRSEPVCASSSAWAAASESVIAATLTGAQVDSRLVAHRVVLIPGDGTGPELTETTRRVLEATGVAFDWDVQEAGVDVMETAGTPLPQETLDSV